MWRAFWADRVPFKGPKPRLVHYLRNSRGSTGCRCKGPRKLSRNYHANLIIVLWKVNRKEVELAARPVDEWESEPPGPPLHVDGPRPELHNHGLVSTPDRLVTEKNLKVTKQQNLRKILSLILRYCGLASPTVWSEKPNFRWAKATFKNIIFSENYRRLKNNRSSHTSINNSHYFSNKYAKTDTLSLWILG